MSLCNYQCTCSLDRASCPARSWSWQKAWVEFFQLLSKPHLANLAWPAPYSGFSDLTWLQDHSSIERSRLQVEFSPPYPGCIVYGCLGHVFCCEWDASCDCWCLVRTQQAPSQCAAGYNSVGVFSEATQQGCLTASTACVTHQASSFQCIHDLWMTFVRFTGADLDALGVLTRSLCFAKSEDETSIFVNSSDLVEFRLWMIRLSEDNAAQNCSWWPPCFWARKLPRFWARKLMSVMHRDFTKLG